MFLITFASFSIPLDIEAMLERKGLLALECCRHVDRNLSLVSPGPHQSQSGDGVMMVDFE